jgi:phosphoribosylformimino-5-aminoimidazole carboxamide ribotide isomerase
MRFRPCIDLHQGRVKQIVGATLGDQDGPVTHFTAERPASWFAEVYKRDGLEGGHVIQLGSGNETAATQALAAYPGGLQVGGGITPENAPGWLDRGASRVIATSYLFLDGRLQPERLARLAAAVGPERLVLDLSCAPRDGRYVVMTDRWQRATDLEVTAVSLERLAGDCAEFLVHATAVEGRQQGPDPELIALLADASPLPTTYAGGIATPADVDLVELRGQGRLDFTVGAALDLFGGSGLCYADLVALDRQQRKKADGAEAGRSSVREPQSE